MERITRGDISLSRPEEILELLKVVKQTFSRLDENNYPVDGQLIERLIKLATQKQKVDVRDQALACLAAYEDNKAIEREILAKLKFIPTLFGIWKTEQNMAVKKTVIIILKGLSVDDNESRSEILAEGALQLLEKETNSEANQEMLGQIASFVHNIRLQFNTASPHDLELAWMLIAFLARNLQDCQSLADCFWALSRFST